MTDRTTSDSPLDTVTALMQERAKFEAWLQGIEDRRASTPPNVYERVRGDYAVRLAAVVEELKAHARELEAQAEAFTQKLAELAEREQSRRDARSEAELRAHVGELSADAWDATAKEADDALAAIAAEQAVLGADLNRVHELLGAANAEPAPPAPPASVPAPEPAPVSVSTPVAPEKPAPRASVELGVPTVEARSEPSDEAAAKSDQSLPEFDDVAFVHSVMSPANAAPPVDPTRRPSGVVDARADEIPRDDNSDAAESLVSRAGRPSQEREFVREDDDQATAGLVGRAGDPARPFAANVTGNHPIVLRPSGAVEQPKTLKCGECGSLNYPTEWYCERCGAELASL